MKTRSLSLSTDCLDDARSGLATILSQLPEQELRDLARARGCTLPGADRSQLVSGLVELLADHTGTARIVVSLPPLLREALRAAFVAEDGCGVTPSGMALAMSSMRPESEPEVKPVEAAGFLSDLARVGLLLAWRDSLHQMPQYWLPWEVQQLVPPLPGWCQAEPIPPSPDIRSRDTADALSQLVTVWQHIATVRPRRAPPGSAPVERRLAAGLQGWPIEQAELARLRRGRKLDISRQLLTAPPAAMLLAEPALQELATAISGEAEEADLFCRLLVELGLVELTADHLVARKHAWEQFSAQTVQARARSLAHAYQSLANWSELDSVLRQSTGLVLWHNAQYACSYQHFRSRLVRMRHLLLRSLACTGETGWLPLDRVEAAIRRLWPQMNALLDAPVTAWGVAVRDSSGRFSPHSTPSWDQVEGRILRFMLQGPLHWLGWVQLSLEGERLVAYRSTGLANWVWDRPAPSEPVGSVPLTVEQRGSEVMVLVRPHSVCASVHVLLGRIAELQEAAPDRFVYQLDPRRACAEFEVGHSAAELLAEWNRCLSATAPPAVTEALNDWWSRYGRVRLYEGFALLELQDDVLLAELQVSTALSQRIVARITPRLALVAEEDVPLLVKEFSERGYMPRVLD